MNILKELKKVWNNAFKSGDEKQAKENLPETLESLKSEILGAQEEQKSELPKRTELPKAPEGERMERVETDEEALRAKAGESLKGYEAEKLRGIDEKAAKEREKLESESAAREKDKEDRLKDIDAAYSQAKKNVENDALKRGIARSSIALASSAALEGERASGRAETEREYSAAMLELGRLIDEIETGRISSISDLKADVESRIAEKTEQLKAAAEKSDREALKYNNSLAESEAKREAERLKAEEELYAKTLANEEKARELEKASTSKSSDLKTANMYASNYNKMDAFLSSLSHSDAAEVLKSDPFFRANLTEYLYYKLYDKYAR